MSSIKWETADEMMNVLCFAAITAAIEENEPITIDEAVTFAKSMFEKYCDTFGITEVEDPEEEEADEEETDEDPDFTATLEIELDPTIMFEDDDDYYEDDDEEDEDEDEEEDYRDNDDCLTLSDLLNFFNEAL